MKVSDWLKELRKLAKESGHEDLVGSYVAHVDRYVQGIKPEQELERLITLDVEIKWIRR